MNKIGGALFEISTVLDFTMHFNGEKKQWKKQLLGGFFKEFSKDFYKTGYKSIPRHKEDLIKFGIKSDHYLPSNSLATGTKFLF